MRILLVIFVLILISSIGHAQNIRQYILNEGFEISAFENYEILQFVEIKRINEFEDKFWSKDSVVENFKFVIPFDFVRDEISMDSQYGIPVQGLSVGCLYFDCHRRRVIIYLHSKSNFELLVDEGGLDSTIVKNILNYGNLPYFSDVPQNAFIEITISKKIKLEKSEYILSRIAETYLTFIENRVISESIEIKSALEKYPLNIMFTHFIKPAKIRKRDILEIDEELELDLEQ